MDIFTKFNRKNIQDRQVDTLIGLSKGLTADGAVNQAEAEFLFSWLIQNTQTESNNPIFENLLLKITDMLEDGVLDSDESAELLSTLRTLAGEKSEIGELSKSSSLPINEPLPDITFANKSFLFTGTCAYGTRKQCQAVVESLGGILASSVTRDLDYLVLGTYVTDSWAHESFGRKIEKAMDYRGKGLPLFIITEDHWATQGKIL
ncbi:MAG: BRCT domain-containing protein [Oleibacter sp.]|nr:BRCT domain-containing protein [Thalassolituus sp.]